MVSHRYFRFYVYSAVLACFIILVGLIGACSGQHDNPSAPPIASPDITAASGETLRAGNMLWGCYIGHANLEKQIFELTPNRAAAMHSTSSPPPTSSTSSMSMSCGVKATSPSDKSPSTSHSTTLLPGSPAIPASMSAGYSYQAHPWKSPMASGPPESRTPGS